MGKILLLLLLAVLGVLLFRTAKTRPRASAPKPPEAPERIVQCSLCGAFLPESDSVGVDGRISCREPAQCSLRS